MIDSGPSCDGLRANLVYTRDNNTRQVMHMPASPGHDEEETTVQVEVVMNDARKIHAKLALHGFELVDCPNTLTKKTSMKLLNKSRWFITGKLLKQSRLAQELLK